MAKTPLPIRITPHALLATLVEVQYTPRTHAELALGAFHQALEAVGFAYERELTGLLEQRTHDSIEPLFQGQGVSLRIRPARLLFNCVSAAEMPTSGKKDEYLGWTHYFEVIQKVVTQLHRTNQIAAFPAVSVRYINALPGLQLNEQLQVKLPPPGELPPPPKPRFIAPPSPM